MLLALNALIPIYRQKGDLERAARALSELEPRLQRLPAGHIRFRRWSPSGRSSPRRAGTMPRRRPRRIARWRWPRRAGSDKGFLDRILARRSELAFQTGRLDQAAADARAALRLEQEGAPRGSYSNSRGFYYLALGRALQGQGKIDEARAAFASAVEQLRPSVGEEHPATRSAVALAAATATAQPR